MMKKKKTYQSLEIEMVRLFDYDVIRTSIDLDKNKDIDDNETGIEIGGDDWFN